MATWVAAVGQWATVIVAAVAGYFAFGQLKILAEQTKAAAKAHSDDVDIARANLMIKIDNDYESKEIFDSRSAIRLLKNHCHELIRLRQDYSSLSPTQVNIEIVKAFTQKVNSLFEESRNFANVDAEDIFDPTTTHTTANQRFMLLMRLLGWIETVGLLCRKGLLPIDDIVELYEPVFIDVTDMFRSHVELRQNANDEFMINAYWIADISRKARDIRAHKLQTNVKPVGPFSTTAH